MFAISSEDGIIKIGKADYTIIARIKSKLDRFNRIFKEPQVNSREYDMLLECYAQDIYEMCKKFYESNVRRVSE